MQPTYFPWAGYLSLIGQVDTFVFLDDAQYERGSWQNRNRVLVNGKPHWLTVPAQRNFLGQTINQIQIDAPRNWRQKHFRLLAQAYAKHPHTDEMLAIAGTILDAGLSTLGDLNVRIIAELARALGLTTRLVRSSQFGIYGHRTERLIDICTHLACNEYISPIGSTDYLMEDGFSTKTSVSLSFNDFVPDPYPQTGSGTFTSHLSILDVIANIGLQRAAAYLRPNAMKRNESD